MQKKLYDGREMIVNSFKNKIFPLYLRKIDFEDENEDEKTTPTDMPDLRNSEPLDLRTSESSDLRTSESSEEGTPRDMSDTLHRKITDSDKIINKERFKKYFGYNSLSDMQKKLFTTEGTQTNEIIADLTKDDLDSLKKRLLERL